MKKELKTKSANKSSTKKSLGGSMSKTHSSLSQDTAILLVKIIAILGYIGAACGILFSLFMIFGGSFIVRMIPAAAFSKIPISGALLMVIFKIMGIVGLVVSIFGIFVSKGLWNHKNWARIVVLVFASLGVIDGVTSLPQGIIGLLLNGAVIYLLGFDDTIKGLFK